MAITKRQSTSGVSTGSPTTFSKSFVSDVAAGSLLIARGMVPDATGSVTITDDRGQTWTVVNTKDGATGKMFTFAYLVNAAAGPLTITYGNGGSGVGGWSLSIYEFSGVATSSAVDNSDNSGTGSAYFPATTTPATTAFTPSVAGCLIFGSITTRTDPGNIVAGAGFTAGEAATTYEADEYLVQGAAANKACDWTTVSDRGNWYIYVFKPGSSTTAAVTGTGASGAVGNDVRAGAKTIVLTLTGETFVAAGATFDATRQAIIDGIVAASSPTWGWNNTRPSIPVTAVVRTSSTVVTITLPALAGYQTDSNETLTITIPAAALTLGAAIIATPTVTIAKTSTDLTPVDDYTMTGTATRTRP
jgi:hypothetical protein